MPLNSLNGLNIVLPSRRALFGRCRGVSRCSVGPRLRVVSSFRTHSTFCCMIVLASFDWLMPNVRVRRSRRQINPTTPVDSAGYVPMRLVVTLQGRGIANLEFR